MNRKELAEKKLKILKELLYRKCFFCEVLMESKFFDQNENIFPLCEFCLKIYKQLKILGQEKETNMEIIKALDNCFENRTCIFCGEGHGGNFVVGCGCGNCIERYKELKKIETDLKD